MEKEFNSLSTEKCLIYRVFSVSDDFDKLESRENFCFNIDVAINMQRVLFCLGYYKVSIEAVDCYTKF